MTHAPDESSSLGDLLRWHRVEAGLTQEDLADVAQVSVRSISDLERGLHRVPHRDTVRRLGHALHLEPEEQAAFERARPPRTLSLVGSEPAPSDASTRIVSERTPTGERHTAITVPGNRGAAGHAPWHDRVSLIWRTLRGRSRRGMTLIMSACLALALLAGAFVWVRMTSQSQSAAPAFGRLVASLPLPSTVGPTLQRPTALAVSGQGQVYVLDGRADRVMRYSARGILLDSWGSKGSGPGQMMNPSGLALDARGGVYICDTGNNRVEKFTPSGKLLAVWGSPGGRPGRFDSPQGITIGRDGLIYIADSLHGRVQVLDPSGHTRTDDPHFYGEMTRPVGLAVDATGSVFASDPLNNELLKYSPTGVEITASWSGSGGATWLALDDKGNLYVSDPLAREVTEYRTTGALVRTWHAHAPGSDFGTPGPVAVGPDAAVYVVDSSSSRILKLSSGRWSAISLRSQSAPEKAGPQAIGLDGRGNVYALDGERIIKKPASGSWFLYWHASANAGSRFVGPIGGIAADHAGRVYATDFGTGDALKLSGSPVRVQQWGQPATIRQTWHPEHIAVDSRGRVYIVGQQRGTLLVLAPSGQMVRSSPVGELFSNLGLAPYPRGVAVDSKGTVYITDELNDQVLEYAADGTLRSTWGSRGAGPGQFRAPEGIAVDDRKGRVYVADTGNNRVAVFSVSGRPLGSHAFDRPTDVAIDPQTDKLWVAESGFRTLRVYALK